MSRFSALISAALILCAALAPAVRSAPGASLAITSVSPGSGRVGTPVTLSGAGFDGAGIAVSFNGTAAAVLSVSATGTRLRTRVPLGATSGDLAVTDATGFRATSPQPFEVSFGATLTRRTFYASQPLRVLGSAFPPATRVAFAIDGKTFGHADTDDAGSLRAVRRLPVELPPGRNHILGITCNGCDVIQLPFNLRGDWPQHRWGAAQTGTQPVEWELTPANVTGLKFKPFPNDLPTVGPMVQWGQYLYAATRDAAGGFLAFAYDVSGASPVFFRSFRTDVVNAPVPNHLSVADGVLQIGWQTTFYAFDARRIKGCNKVTRICENLWEAGDNPGNAFEPVLSDGLLLNYAAGKLTAYDARGTANCAGLPPACTPLWKKDGMSGRLATWPIAEGGNGNVFVYDGFGVNKGLHAYDRDGNKAPSFPVAVQTGADSRIAVSAGRLALIRDPNQVPARLTVMNALTGATLWRADLPNSLPGSAPAITPTRVYVTLVDGRTLAFNATGCGAPVCNPLWSTPQRQIGAAIPPVVAGNVLFAAARLKAIDTADTPAAYDANGVVGCSGTPKVCQPLWTAPVPLLKDREFDTMLVAGGWLRIATRAGFTMYHR